MKNFSTDKGFTLMEIMIVVVIIGVVAGFAIPNYTKSVEQSYLQDATMQLSAIRSANQVYYSRSSSYWPLSGSNNISAINSALSLSIVENGLTYLCSPGGTPGTTFSCTATRTGGAFVVTVTEAVLSAGVNPSCSGTCP